MAFVNARSKMISVPCAEYSVQYRGGSLTIENSDDDRAYVFVSTPDDACGTYVDLGKLSAVLHGLVKETLKEGRLSRKG